ncbi:TPA: hypothetical protein ACPYV0_004433 [Citrobacter amalonaticus]|uniref:hypothetical protein n=1 Tax=Citrobacter amalonaticus TaxID=35703 RepID=UPI0019053F7F|nr:hypothetical protein [Citrobacter amalonaticus]MBJ9328031.1 hypothetical protein [Citrobacter amalonaticus]HCD1278901.1 hypothetical protein [Citrobacter amalonaticus]HCL5925975.1 hypothetical protein [Citrobacter amalonaticus]
MRIWTKVVLLISLLVTVSTTCIANPVNMDIRISGTVVANGSCSFGQEQSTIDFKEVNFAIVNGVMALTTPYREPLPAAMTCSGDSAGAQMTFSSSAGAAVDYEGHKLLPVSINDSNAGSELGIRLLVNGEIQDLNAPFAVDVQTQPTIEAELVLVGNGDGLISGARISASATLLMEFV